MLVSVRLLTPVGSVRPLPDKPADVLILRSGYASRALYLQAIAQAEGAGRAVRALEDPFRPDPPEDDW